MKKVYIDRPDLKSLSLIDDYRNRIKNFHKLWKPHPGQEKAGYYVFGPEKRRVIMLQCGRKWGKTEFAIYCAWRYALTHPKANIYIIYPERSQAAEVIWADERLQNFGPREYLCDGDDSANKTELRIRFKNAAFIKLEGSENYNRLRGYTPDLVIYDEYKDHNPNAHLSMRPNLVAKQAQLIIIGTPPDKKCHYTEMKDLILDEIKVTRNRYFYIEAPSWENPDPGIQEDIKEERRLAEKHGKMAEFNREYGAQFIPGGANAVFPQFDRKRHIRSPTYIDKLITPDKRKLDFYAIFDPGTSTCFAVLFLAHNKFTSQVYVLGEIYEKDRKQTTVGRIWPRAIEIMNEWYDEPDEWNYIYDEAAASFAEEISDNYQIQLTPTQKKSRDKDRDIGLAKSIMAETNRLFVSSDCEYFPHEIENYITKDNGEYQKDDDHLIDCFRYFLSASDYKLIEEPDEEEVFRYKELEKPPRMISLEEDLRNDAIKDFTYDEDAPYYDEEEQEWTIF